MCSNELKPIGRLPRLVGGLVDNTFLREGRTVIGETGYESEKGG